MPPGLGDAEASGNQMTYGLLAALSWGVSTLLAAVAARRIGEVTAGARQWVKTNPSLYRELARRHAAGVRPVPEPQTGDGSQGMARRGFDGLPSAGRPGRLRAS